MYKRTACSAIALLGGLVASTSLAAQQTGEATILWSQSRCEMVLVEKPSGEYGVVLRLSDGRVDVGDKLEGDFESVNQIRPIKNLSSGEDIMMRGVRYSTSRRYVLQVMPRWCKAPKE